MIATPHVNSINVEGGFRAYMWKTYTDRNYALLMKVLREKFLGSEKNISFSSQVKIERSMYINQFPLKAFFMSKVANLSVTGFACYFYFYKLSIPTRDIPGFFFMLYTEMNIPD